MPPLLATWIQLRQIYLSPGFLPVAPRAKSLQVFRVEALLRRKAHRFDVIDLKAPTCPALPAPKAVALEDRPAERPPAPGARDGSGVPLVLAPHAHDSFTVFFGTAFIRAPCATARTVAAAASIRPVDRPLASL